MSYGAANARSRSRAWTRDPVQVLNLARDLIRVGVLKTADDVLEYWEAPYGWSREHEWWMEHGCTDDPGWWAEAGLT